MLTLKEFWYNYDHRKVSDKDKVDMDLDDVEAEIDNIAAKLIIKV